MNIDPTLATGGLVAAAAMVGAFWRNLRTAFSYFSSFLVVQSHISPNVGTSVRRYLKASWKPLNLSKVFIKGEWMNLPSVAAQTIVVPFHLKPEVGLWYKDGKVIWVRFDNSHVLINSIRGNFNVRDLVIGALTYELSYRTRENSRFYLRRVIGSEKGLWGQQSSRRGQESRAPDPDRNSVVETSGTPNLDIDLDDSFMYPTSVITQPWVQKDPFEDLYFNPLIQSYIKQAKLWYSMGNWYRERSIPWKRGWLLHGPGGTGKSSFAKAIAQTLKIPLYHFQLSTLSDQEFIEAWSDMDAPCIALLEDFDTVFHGRESQTDHKSLSFECVLNTLSGVSSNEGIFLIVTTNHIDLIDPAMGVKSNDSDVSTRPGRLDNIIYFGYMEEDERRKLATRILKDWPETIESLVNQHTEVSPIQFQEICLQTAFKLVNSDTLKTVN